MKLFVYEFVTGGGTWQTAGSIEPAGSLLAEGRAMAGAVIADLAAAGHEVQALLDRRLRGRVALPCAVELVGNTRDEAQKFGRLVEQSDATLVIAPEIGGALLERCLRVERAGGRLISPGSAFVAIAADKHATAERLSAAGIRVPPGIRLAAPLQVARDDLFPAVVKPCDGAGSWLVKPVANVEELRGVLHQPAQREMLHTGNLRLERRVHGLPASVAVLCGPRSYVPQPPCEQILGGDGLEYHGGRLPLAPPLAERACSLATAALGALPPVRGYVGIDLILGPADDGSQDYVIEINPRLTTSYVGLRAACRQNLAVAMLAVAAGEEASVWPAEEEVEFRADGTIRSPGSIAS